MKSCYPLVTSVMTRVSSIFVTLPEHSDVIVRAPNLGSPPPPPPHPPVFRTLVHPRVFTRFMGIVALDTLQQNNPCQLYVDSPPVTDMWNEQNQHNERKTDNQDLTPRPYSCTVPASSHHNRNLPLILGRVKNVMKGYCPPTSMGLPNTVHVDNIGAIWLSNSRNTGDRKKHIDIRTSFVKEYQEDGKIIIKFVKSEDNEADIFTKNTSNIIFQRHQEKLVWDKKEVTEDKLPSRGSKYETTGRMLKSK